MRSLIHPKLELLLMLWDIDKEVAKSTGKKEILVIGDFFAAGHGLENVSERFSDQLEEKLGKSQYIVYNLGVSGADTRDEYKRLKEFPVKPDVIILQYFPNDIEKAGREKGLSLSGTAPYADLKGPMASLVKRFYLPNFIYWQLPHASFSTFEKFVQTAYSDTTILNSHLQDLINMIACRDSTGQKCTVFLSRFYFNWIRARLTPSLLKIIFVQKA